jgi:phage terminase large subunit
VTRVSVELPPKLVDVFTGEADVRGAYGGRGSTKTRSFAKMTAVKGYMWDKAGRKGIILCGRQFMNSLDDSSLEEIKEAIRSEPWLAEAFDIGEKYIRTKSGRISYKFTGLDRNVASVKSKSRVLLCWVDEAEAVEDDAWSKLIPTLREEDSELWVTWNPELRKSATHKRFRETQDPRMKVVEINWRDNPWFPAVLERTRLRDMANRPEDYDHIWEGGFKTAVVGAYFAAGLTKAKTEGRIGKVAPDPLLSIRAYWDIGGTGAKADAVAIWLVQFVGKEIRVVDYYEAQGQPLATHVTWLRANGYEKCTCVLPHDGETQDRVFDVSYQSALTKAEFPVIVIPNQGKGAAAMRIESVRRILPQCWFHEDRTEAGRLALGHYHEHRDETRDVGLGPKHDWSSHAADAFGLMAVAYEEHNKPQADVSVILNKQRASSNAWMR